MRKDLFGRHLTPPHPGEILREDILPAYGLTRKALAAALKVNVRLVSDVLRERRPITPDLAARLDMAIGGGVHYWLGLQCQHDVFVARRLEVPGIRRLTRTPRHQQPPQVLDVGRHGSRRLRADAC